MPLNKNEALALGETLERLPWQERLGALRGREGVVLSTSFSAEDQALTHVLVQEKILARIFTLDTGRLHEETHKTHADTIAHYGVTIATYAPEAAAIEHYVAAHGINGFYNSIEQRKGCCGIRKVEPLNRALKDAQIWISGLRREHSDNRSTLKAYEWDEARQILKLYPLIDVAEDVLWGFIRTHHIPYNSLHDKGFPSIGCAPCTRAIRAGEQPRAGRWWWEETRHNECGLHMVDGKLVRTQQNA